MGLGWPCKVFSFLYTVRYTFLKEKVKGTEKNKKILVNQELVTSITNIIGINKNVF